MKLFLFLIGMVAAGFLGYSYEPHFRHQLTGKTPTEKKAVSVPKVAAVPAPDVEADPAKIATTRLPEKVMLKADAEISDPASDVKMTITAGNRANLIRVEGENVIISPGAGPYEGTVPVSQTDLLEQLAALPQDPDLPSLEPAPQPEAPAGSDEFEVAEEPAASEPSSAEPEAATDGPVDVVAIMQASIRKSDIKEFTFDQVLDWLPGENPETVDGETYATGIASYKAETVFGVKTIQAKAFIKDGKVVRWLWPKSGMEIK
ncbi:MAG: hypothetical protein H7Y36_12845 [Armatimonadetes bacterium]|nr:hypothetical protein [Akkermansiaceae bacterium]